MLTISAEQLSHMSDGEREALSAFVLNFSAFPRVAAVPVAVDRRLGPLPTVEAPSLEEAEPSPEQAFASVVPVAPALPPFPPAALDTLKALANVDKGGLPWDERIHSSSKNFTADGNWRKKRGVDEALIAQVEAQLKQLMGLPSPEARPVASVPAPPTVTVPAPPIITAPVELGDGKQAYISFIGRVSEAIVQKKITQDEVTAICQKYGIVSLVLLAHRFDLVPQIAMEAEALIVTR